VADHLKRLAIDHRLAVQPLAKLTFQNGILALLKQDSNLSGQNMPKYTRIAK